MEFRKMVTITLHVRQQKTLLLLSRFSRVRLCATPQTAAHQAPPSLGFSRQEHWSGVPFPSPMHESEKWKWSCSVVFDSLWPHGLQPTRLLCLWDFLVKSTGVPLPSPIQGQVNLNIKAFVLALHNNGSDSVFAENSMWNEVEENQMNTLYFLQA